MSALYKLFLFLACGILISSCAIIQSPTGGEKDNEEPDIKKSEPLIGSKNYDGNAIRLYFDEFIVLNNLQQELTVSPPLKHPPEFKIKGKSLLITFKDTLLENTTYTFNLGDGVKDFHEGNILDSNVVVFSTGNDIDSGFVSGTVINAKTLKPISKALVMLYPELSDSIPAKKRPAFLTKTKLDGSYEINYLKTGSYQIFVLEDLNSNYLYDLPNEKIGFADETIEINGSIGVINANIRVFQEYTSNQFFKESKLERYGKLLLGFNQPLKKLSLRPFNYFKPDTAWYTLEFDTQKDTAWVWTNAQMIDDEPILIELTDQGIVLDTFEFKPIAYPEEEVKQQSLRSNFSLNTKQNVAKYFEKLVITSSTPIKKANAKGVIILGTDTTALKTNQLSINDFEIDYKLDEEKHYKVIIYKNSFIDALDLGHDTLSYEFRTLSEVEYANLRLSLITSNLEPKVIQLLDEKGKEVIKEDVLTNQTKLNYPNLSPGKYKIKMIFDENNNGIWDPGTFIPRKQAERIIYFSEELEMKEGWDKKIDWTIPE
ncbi:MAG: Ig-like domain-containing protein [Salibacteraceae bacterium]